MIRKVLSMFLIAIIAITCVMVVPIGKTIAAVQETYYVDPVNGSDNNNGLTTSTAFKTITKARDTVRTINSNMTGDIYIYLRGGSYNLTDTLNFTTSDSGTNGYYIYYKAYSTETPVINAGKTITGWTQVADTNLYKASISGVSDFRQVYVNGVMAQRARSSSRLVGIGWYDDTSDYTSTRDGIYVSSNDVGLWSNVSGMEVHYTIQWMNMYFTAESILDGGAGQSIIRMTQPYFHWGKFMYDICYGTLGPEYNTPFYLENAYELLDSPGEWYFKKSTNELFYYPKSGENMSTATVKIPVLEKIMDISGTDKYSKAQNISFEGITFELSSWLYPSQKAFIGWQAEDIFNQSTGGTIYDIEVPGSIELDCAQYIKFKNNIINKIGNVGIRLKNAVKNVEISGNVFKDISDAAVTVGLRVHSYVTEPTPPSPTPTPDATVPTPIPVSSREVCTDNIIKNNLITRIGQDYWGAPAITAFYVDGLIISHNDISDIPYTGISVGWGWSSTTSSTTCRDNVIEYNKIDNYMQKARDGGAIYTLGNQPNSVVRFNYVKNQNYVCAGLYHDEGSAYYETYNNVVDISSGSNWINFWTDTIHDIDAHDNYTATPRYCNRGTDVTITDAIVVPDRNWPQAALDIIDEAGLEPAYSGLLDLKGGPPAASIPTNGLISWLKADEGVINDGTDKVKDWVDQSNKGNGFIQRNAAQQPLYVANAVNGYPAIRFDGTDDNLISDSVRWLCDNYTVIIVMKPTALRDCNQQLLSTGWGKFAFHTTSDGGIYAGSEVSQRIEPSDGPGAETMVANTWQQFAYTFEYEYSPFFISGLL